PAPDHCNGWPDDGCGTGYRGEVMAPQDVAVGGDEVDAVLKLVSRRAKVRIELEDFLSNELGVYEIPQGHGPDPHDGNDNRAHGLLQIFIVQYKRITRKKTEDTVSRLCAGLPIRMAMIQAGTDSVEITPRRIGANAWRCRDGRGKTAAASRRTPPPARRRPPRCDGCAGHRRAAGNG